MTDDKPIRPRFAGLGETHVRVQDMLRALKEVALNTKDICPCWVREGTEVESSGPRFATFSVTLFCEHYSFDILRKRIEGALPEIIKRSEVLFYRGEPDDLLVFDC